MSSSASSKPKQSPYVGYFRGNGSRTASRLFEPNSHPHIGVYRHAPAKTTSKGLQEILLDNRASLKPKSVISTLQLFNSGPLPKHIEKKTLESMPTSHFTSNDNEMGDTPMCPICLEHFVDGDEIRNLKCSHCFHKSCVDIWLLGTMSNDVTTTVCPTCRQDASSVISEPESGGSVYSSPCGDSVEPLSTIPAECFLRVGQYLQQEGNKKNVSACGSLSSSNSSSSNSHVPSASPPLPPIASTRSPPLPPQLQLPPSPLPLPPCKHSTKQKRLRRQRSSDLTSATVSPTAAFVLSTVSVDLSPEVTDQRMPSQQQSSSNSPPLSSVSSASSLSSQSTLSSDSPTMFFPALDDYSVAEVEQVQNSFVTVNLIDTNEFAED